MLRSTSALLVLALAPSAFAGTATDNISVSATVAADCNITANALSFGTYDTLAGTAVDQSANLDVACTTGTAATVTLGQGANADTGSSAAVPLRRMSDGATGFLSYTLYSDSGYTTVFGDTAPTGAAYTAATNGTSQVVVYGRITASQDVPVGSYTDTVLATITF